MSDGTVQPCAWAGATTAAFSGDGPSGNQVSFSTVWRSGQLYVRVDVTDSSVEVDAAEIWMRDGVEVFISPQAHGGSAIQASDRHIIIDAAGEIWSGGTQPQSHRVTALPDGFRVELSITNEDLGATVESDSVFGFLIANNNRDGGTTSFSDWAGAVLNGGGYGQPSRWGELQFTDEEVTCSLPGCGDGVCEPTPSSCAEVTACPRTTTAAAPKTVLAATTIVLSPVRWPAPTAARAARSALCPTSPAAALPAEAFS